MTQAKKGYLVTNLQMLGAQASVPPVPLAAAQCHYPLDDLKAHMYIQLQKG